eukprot:11475331-Karenia_brevis.AAC.1
MLGTRQCKGPDIGPLATAPAQSLPPPAAYVPHSTTAVAGLQAMPDIQALLDAHAAKVQAQTTGALSALNVDITESTQHLITDVANQISQR